MKDTTFDLPLFRTTDPDTSRQVHPSSAQSHRATLLSQYARSILGLTDEQAGQWATEAGITIAGYWKRCADLRSQGLIADTGERRLLTTGAQGMVCRITDLGFTTWEASR